MEDTLDHENTMKLAVTLTCSHLARTGSASGQVDELIAHFYRQVRSAEGRLRSEQAAVQKVEETPAEEAAE